jgi:ELWxxDGT repeat protein
MRLTSLFRRRRAGSLPKGSKGRPGGRRQARSRPILELLENRCLPASGVSAALVADILPGSLGSNPAHYVVLNNTLYFAANDGVHGTELYKSDGTAAGTVLVNDINPGSGDANPTDLTPVGGTLYFRADDGVHGQELWKTDGTAGGTVLVKDINPGSSGSAPASPLIEDMANINGILFFTANDGVNGPELWKSDGSAAGTVLVKDINSGSAGSLPMGLTNVNGVAFFSADDGKNGRELWKSDGTAKGTALVKDIWTGSSYSISFDGRSSTKYPNSSFPSDLTNVNGTLYFLAADGFPIGVTWHLYKTDGTARGTVRVSEVLAGGNLLNVGGTLWFTGDDGVHGTELYKSDGTAAGTALVADINPGSAGSSPTALTNVNGVVFFSAYDGAHGQELWKSDGTAAGTVLVKDIYPGTDSYGNPNSSGPSQLTNVNGLLYLSADDGVHGNELWQSDGTAAGTVLVKDINPGSAASDPQDLVAMTNKLYFSADDGVHGRELWDPPAVGGATPGQVLPTLDDAAGSRPFKGVAVGAVTGVLPSGAVVVQSAGNATLLGAFTRTEFVFFGPGGAISGTIIFTAANGDQLWASFSGGFTSPTTAAGTYTFTGGTGRFRDATGTASFEATTPDGIHLTVSFAGSISYSGPDEPWATADLGVLAWALAGQGKAAPCADATGLV